MMSQLVQHKTDGWIVKLVDFMLDTPSILWFDIETIQLNCGTDYKVINMGIEKVPL